MVTYIALLHIKLLVTSLVCSGGQAGSSRIKSPKLIHHGDIYRKVIILSYVLKIISISSKTIDI